MYFVAMISDIRTLLLTLHNTPSSAIWFIITEDGIWIMGVIFPNIIKSVLEDESGGGNSTVLMFSKFSWVAICAPITSNTNYNVWRM